MVRTRQKHRHIKLHLKEEKTDSEDQALKFKFKWVTKKDCESRGMFATRNLNKKCLNRENEK